MCLALQLRLVVSTSAKCRQPHTSSEWSNLHHPVAGVHPVPKGGKQKWTEKLLPLLRPMKVFKSSFNPDEDTLDAAVKGWTRN
jgi:hypothetical protein